MKCLVSAAMVLIAQKIFECIKTLNNLLHIYECGRDVLAGLAHRQWLSLWGQ